MLEIVLKVSFVIAIALLFYKLVLQQESFFSTNRFYFIGCMVLAFLLPYAALPELISHQGYLSKVLQSETSLSTLQNGKVYKGDSYNAIPQNKNIPDQTVTRDQPVAAEQPQTAIANINWLLMLYLFGVIIFTLNLLFQLANILLLITKSKDKISDGDYVIVNTPNKQAPCSFFKYIFVHPNDYDFETYEQILAHEKIHVRLGHTWDLLIAELAVIILWFNPLVWFYKREIEKNIEFQTDALLLEREQISKARYQLNLLQIATPYKPLTITTNYNQSLLKQRIEMMNAKKSTVNRYWKYAFTAPMFLAALLFLNEPVTSQDFEKDVPNVVATPEPASIPSPAGLPNPAPKANPAQHANVTPAPHVNPAPLVRSTLRFGGGKEDMSHGFFYSYINDNEYCIEFKGIRSSGQNHGSWNFSNCFDKKLFQKTDNEVYTLTKEAGTLKLLGPLEKEVSQGKYEFIKDNSFEQYLIKNNINSDNRNYLFHLFQTDVDRKFVDFIKSKFSTITADQFLAMAIHDVNKNYIDEMEKAGFKNLSVDQLMRARIHGVTGSTAKEMQALGFGDLSLDKMVELKIHDITPAYVQELKSAGLKDLTINQVVQAKIHGVNAASIKEMQKLGFGDLSMNKMIELQIHDVDAAYIQELKAAGVQDLSLNKAIEAKIHGVNASTIKEMQNLGYGELSINKIIELKIHDVNPAYIQELKSAGFKDLSLSQIMQAKIHGLDGASIKEIQSLGFKDVSFDQFVAAKMHGVDAAFIQDAKANGYNLKTLEEYTKVKMHGMVRNNQNKSND